MKFTEILKDETVPVEKRVLMVTSRIRRLVGSRPMNGAQGEEMVEARIREAHELRKGLRDLGRRKRDAE